MQFCRFMHNAYLTECRVDHHQLHKAIRAKDKSKKPPPLISRIVCFWPTFGRRPPRLSYGPPHSRTWLPRRLLHHPPTTPLVPRLDRARKGKTSSSVAECEVGVDLMEASTYGYPRPTILVGEGRFSFRGVAQVTVLSPCYPPKRRQLL